MYHPQEITIHQWYSLTRLRLSKFKKFIFSFQFGVLPKVKETDREKLLRKKEKQKAKDESKLEKRRIKEEKLRKVADKEKERDKKKQQKIKPKTGASGGPSKIADFIQVRLLTREY